MTDPAFALILASTITIAVTIFAAVTLHGWRSWLEVRRLEIGDGATRPRSTARLELADLRERVRGLERIANGQS